VWTRGSQVLHRPKHSPTPHTVRGRSLEKCMMGDFHYSPCLHVVVVVVVVPLVVWTFSLHYTVFFVRVLPCTAFWNFLALRKFFPPFFSFFPFFPFFFFFFLLFFFFFFFSFFFFFFFFFPPPPPPAAYPFSNG